MSDGDTARTTRSPMAGLRPLPDKKRASAHSKAIFNEHAQAILDEWERRRRNPPGRRAESANSWLKREAYGLIRHYIENEMTSVFRRNLRADRRPNRLVEDAIRNPFKLGLLAMFADESVLSRTNRHAFGNQMLFAWAHDVPTDFLNAFLAISGGPAQIAQKIKAEEAEPGFEHRFDVKRLRLNL